MKYVTGLLGHYEEWRVDRRNPQPPRYVMAALRKRRGSK